MTKPHPSWSHLSITGPGPPSFSEIAVSLETVIWATTTVLQPSQSASPTLARRTTEASMPADTFDEPATPYAPHPSRTPRPHKPVSSVSTANWLTLTVPIPAITQTTLSPRLKLKIVAKHSKTGAGTSRQLPKVSLAQPSSALLNGAESTSTPLPTGQEQSASASSSSINTLPAYANNSATISEPVTRARTRMSHAKTPSSSPTLPPK